MTDIVTFTDVTKVFGKPQKGQTPAPALDHITLGVREGSITGVIGYSGAGKSTLVRLVNALETPTSGSVVVDGQEVTSLGEAGLKKLRSTIGMIFQQFNLFNSRSVAANVGYPLKLAGWSKAKREARVKELLEFVGIADKAKQRPSQLSGGQKQRVGIARALATDPKILLADEATSALDPETTQDVLGLLTRINRELGTTILVITHEMHVVRSICHEVAVLEKGALLEAGPVYDIFAYPKNAATRRFIASTIQDRPTPETVARLKARHQGRLVTVSVVDRAEAGGSVDVAGILQRVGGVHADVVYGSVTEIRERPIGSLTYVLRGDEASIGRAVEELKGLSEVIDWSEDTEEAA
jgi:D-methionine transport system ATP-binding protein